MVSPQWLSLGLQQLPCSGVVLLILSHLSQLLEFGPYFTNFWNHHKSNGFCWTPRRPSSSLCATSRSREISKTNFSLDLILLEPLHCCFGVGLWWADEVFLSAPGFEWWWVVCVCALNPKKFLDTQDQSFRSNLLLHCPQCVCVCVCVRNIKHENQVFYFYAKLALSYKWGQCDVVMKHVCPGCDNVQFFFVFFVVFIKKRKKSTPCCWFPIRNGYGTVF